MMEYKKFAPVTDEEVEQVREHILKRIKKKDVAVLMGTSYRRIEYICAKYSIRHESRIVPLYYVDGLPVTEQFHHYCKKLYVRLETGRWQLLKVYLYMKAYGVKVNRMDSIRCIDGNEYNVELSNLVLVTRQQLMEENGHSKEARIKQSISQRRHWAKFKRFRLYGLPTKSFTDRIPCELRPRRADGKFEPIDPAKPLTVYKRKEKVYKRKSKQVKEVRVYKEPAKGVQINSY